MRYIVRMDHTPGIPETWKVFDTVKEKFIEKYTDIESAKKYAKQLNRAEKAFLRKYGV